MPISHDSLDLILTSFVPFSTGRLDDSMFHNLKRTQPLVFKLSNSTSSTLHGREKSREWLWGTLSIGLTARKIICGQEIRDLDVAIILEIRGLFKSSKERADAFRTAKS